MVKVSSTTYRLTEASSVSHVAILTHAPIMLLLCRRVRRSSCLCLRVVVVVLRVLMVLPIRLVVWVLVGEDVLLHDDFAASCSRLRP